ncbi:hypothetical protein PDIP_38560 [Penicillium digitatum Pd1]|uniref:Uncharacterized protein n=1 Tax=Penicillium digitatum (strain Pd1 / CECT 20795) TaxID=1170230 RepID=K9GMG0_PEND1|nr:hypothetical protein PDIP_38560 [Penicillium digitatum Pd1]EKV15873.1 hypothetical protein PDIP_38560 [Penicillium digitatum Pd1]KAG0153650.1 hypothetical protein PDIDSM_2304 [Penicillium digitatum]
MLPPLLTIFRRDCDGDETKSSCTKPTSSAVTVGIPAVISGVIIITAIIVLIVLYHKGMRRDDREDLEEQRRKSGFYARYDAQQNIAGKARPSKGQPHASQSRRSSADSIFDFKQDQGRYHIAPLPSPEPPKPAATRVLA